MLRFRSLSLTPQYICLLGEWDEARQVFIDANDQPSTFDSIPSAFWFVMVTITTTGYGDMVPTTFVGKLISFPAMMCGILLITLPSIIIGRNFTLVWEAMQQYRRQAAVNTREQNVDSTEGKQRERNIRRFFWPPCVYNAITQLLAQLKLIFSLLDSE